MNSECCFIWRIDPNQIDRPKGMMLRPNAGPKPTLCMRIPQFHACGSRETIDLAQSLALSSRYAFVNASRMLENIGHRATIITLPGGDWWRSIDVKDH